MMRRSRVLIESDTQISGFQFEINQNQLTSYFDPEDLVIPNGWHLNHLMLGDNIKILAYDPTGENSVEENKSKHGIKIYFLLK